MAGGWVVEWAGYKSGMLWLRYEITCACVYNMPRKETIWAVLQLYSSLHMPYIAMHVREISATSPQIH